MFVQSHLLVLDCCVLLWSRLWSWFVLLLLVLDLGLLVLTKVQSLENNYYDGMVFMITLMMVMMLMIVVVLPR